MVITGLITALSSLIHFLETSYFESPVTMPRLVSSRGSAFREQILAVSIFYAKIGLKSIEIELQQNSLIQLVIQVYLFRVTIKSNIPNNLLILIKYAFFDFVIEFGFLNCSLYYDNQSLAGIYKNRCNLVRLLTAHH